MKLLDKAVQLEQEADAFGFSWETPQQIMDQIESECLEVREHLVADDATRDNEALEEEMGDLLHAALSLCVFYKFDPKITIKKTLDKFERRLNAVKSLAEEQGLAHLKGHEFDELMQFWDAAKQQVG